MSQATDAAVRHVLVRAADAGDTFVAWRWLDDPQTPYAERLDTTALTAALDVLNSGLLYPPDGRSRDEWSAAILTNGPLANRESEAVLARRLAEAVLPARLRSQILARARSGERVRVRVTPSPRLARVPFELLALEGDRRLIEVADIRYDPPSTVHVDRGRTPPPGGWGEVKHLPVLYVVDPVLPPSLNAEGGDAQTLTLARARRVWADRLADRVVAGRALSTGTDGGQAVPHVHAELARHGSAEDPGLRELLRTDHSRLFYFGHVSSDPDEPGSAALHLHDTNDNTWGMAEVPGGRAAHRPLNALDLLLGTLLAPSSELGTPRSPAPDRVAGHEIWPMPTRVAVIACEGGADYRSAETFGLVMAMLNAGAELVTTTRWVLPTDSAFHQAHPGGLRRAVPTTTLALRVDEAHEQADPVADLADWQREQLAAWRHTGSIEHTPLLWAALTHTHAAARADAPRFTLSGANSAIHVRAPTG